MSKLAGVQDGSRLAGTGVKIGWLSSTREHEMGPQKVYRENLTMDGRETWKD